MLGKSTFGHTFEAISLLSTNLNEQFSTNFNNLKKSNNVFEVQSEDFSFLSIPQEKNKFLARVSDTFNKINDKSKKVFAEFTKEEEKKESNSGYWYYWDNYGKKFVIFLMTAGVVVYSITFFGYSIVQTGMNRVDKYKASMKIFLENDQEEFLQICKIARQKALNILKNQKLTSGAQNAKLLEAIFGKGVNPDNLQFFNNNFVCFSTIRSVNVGKKPDEKLPSIVNYFQTKLDFHFPIINKENGAISVLKVVLRSNDDPQTIDSKYLQERKDNDITPTKKIVEKTITLNEKLTPEQEVVENWPQLPKEAEYRRRYVSVLETDEQFWDRVHVDAPKFTIEKLALCDSKLFAKEFGPDFFSFIPNLAPKGGVKNTKYFPWNFKVEDLASKFGLDEKSLSKQEFPDIEIVLKNFSHEYSEYVPCFPKLFPPFMEILPTITGNLDTKQ